MNSFIKKTVMSYLKRGYYSRKHKVKKLCVDDLVDLYIPKNWANKISVTTI